MDSDAEVEKTLEERVEEMEATLSGFRTATVKYLKQLRKEFEDFKKEVSGEMDAKLVESFDALEKKMSDSSFTSTPTAGTSAKGTCTSTLTAWTSAKKLAPEPAKKLVVEKAGVPPPTQFSQVAEEIRKPLREYAQQLRYTKQEKLTEVQLAYFMYAYYMYKDTTTDRMAAKMIAEGRQCGIFPKGWTIKSKKGDLRRYILEKIKGQRKKDRQQERENKATDCMVHRSTAAAQS